MANKRKKFSPEEKVRLLRLHLIEKEPVSDICDAHSLNPNVFYRWQKIFFVNGAAAFAQTGTGRKDSHAKKLVTSQSLWLVLITAGASKNIERKIVWAEGEIREAGG